MSRFVRVVLILSLVTAGVPSMGFARQADATLSGTVYRSNMQPMPQTRVQLRNVRTGDALHVVVSDADGNYSFRFVQPGSYVVEALDAQGRIAGMTTPFEVAGGASVTKSIVLVGSGAVASSGGAGFSLFGLGQTASLAVLGAAGAAGVAAVVATRETASPSR